MRLCNLLIDHPQICNEESQALFALMCFQSARLDSKINEANELIDLRFQDRSTYYLPLVFLGHDMMTKATKSGRYTYYHYEAAIAAEHLSAKTFEDTNWEKIIFWYNKLQHISPSPFNLLNMAIANLELAQAEKAKEFLVQVQPKDLGQMAYLFHGCMAEYNNSVKNYDEAVNCYAIAITLVKNNSELNYMQNKRQNIIDLIKRSR